MQHQLAGKKIAFLATNGFEQSEFTVPWKKLLAAGAEVELVSLEDGEICGYTGQKKGEAFKVDKVVSKVKAADYDGLVLPGGVFNPDTLRMNEKAVSFVKNMYAAKKPIAAICHGPWTLIEADVLRGKTVTSWPSLKTDIKNAGGHWVDKEVCCDQGLVTSRNPDDLDAFCAKAIEEFQEGTHDKQTG